MKIKPLSHTELDLWSEDKERYRSKYIQERRSTGWRWIETPDIRNVLHESFANGNSQIPEKYSKFFTSEKQGVVKLILKTLNDLHVPQKEVQIQTSLNGGIPVMGIYDGFDINNGVLYELKTVNRNNWTQYKVDHNMQLSFYSFLYYLKFRSFFQGIVLLQLNTITGEVLLIETRRTVEHFEQVQRLVNIVYSELVNARLWERRISIENEY